MLALGIRYLCGWSMATDPADRTRPEWPPHPDRVFMALAAAHFETDGGADERAVLEWLESLDPPALAVSEARPRTATTSYVPVNDSAAPRVIAHRPPSADQIASGLALLPESRPRQARAFPAVVPDDPCVHVVWPKAEPTPPIRASLERLCRKITHVGHSASLTQIWVNDDPPPPTLHPDELSQRMRLRVSGGGRLAELERRYVAGMRPSQAPWHGYETAGNISAASIIGKSVLAGDFIVFRLYGRLGLVSTAQFIGSLRATLLQKSMQPPPPWLSGHEPGGRPLSEPHLALVPLPDVGHEYADGHLMGVALILPRTLSSSDMGRTLRQIIAEANTAAGLRVYNGTLLDVTLRLSLVGDLPRALRRDTWTGGDDGAVLWASVTPIVLDRFPKKAGDAERTIKTACERIGLPAPVDVSISKVSRFQGAPISSQFPPYGRADAPKRMQVHATLTFAEPVGGPVLLGAGRYRGYGLCRPLVAHRIVK